MSKQNTSSLAFFTVMLAFFTMGFVDLVGTASNYVKSDLGLSDSEANIMPSLVFFWFLIFSVPTGMLMNKIGRKNTVQLSIIVTAVSLILPIFFTSYPMILIAFSLLGIGNAIMQTSLNPLVGNIVRGDKLASTLTFGQFVKAIASCLAPYLATWGATKVIPSFGLDWRILFPIYAVVAILAIAALGMTKIEEEPAGKAANVGECFKLLGKPFVFLCFLGIVCHVGIDVGTNTYAPRILMEHLGMTVTEAGFGTFLYFICRTVGSFTGSFLLQKLSTKVFFGFCALLILCGMIGLTMLHDQMMIYVFIAMIGYGNSNIFPVCFSQALLAEPTKQNEASGLMIMGLFGGTLFPLVMGPASDAMGTVGAVIVMAAGAAYLTFYTLKIKK